MQMRFTIAMIVLSAALWGCAGAPIRSGEVTSPYFDFAQLEEGMIVHLPTGRTLTEDEFFGLVADHRIVYVGESHDSVQDHEIQLKVLRRMNERFPGKVALGLEMLRRPSQADADRWSSGRMEEKDFVRVWQKNWGNSYPYYAEILRYVRDNRIPLLALNRQKAMPAAHSAMEGGAAKPASPEGSAKPAGGEPAAAMPAPPPAVEATPEPETDESDPYYKAYIGAFFEGHGEGKPEVGAMFLRGQILWDETMAETAADYLRSPENADKRLVVFAGGNHVRYGFGIPRRVFRRIPVSYTIVEPWVVKFPEDKRDRIMEVDLPELPLPMGAFVWGVGYDDLEDQRILLGVRIEQGDPEGAKVLGVGEGSSAEKAGVKEGDVIVAVDGVALKELFDLTYELSFKKVGQKGNLGVLRDGTRIELPVTFEAAEPAKPAAP
jgi:uncharacterized iron-regulated protein